jgi:hypothetical protein
MGVRRNISVLQGVLQFASVWVAQSQIAPPGQPSQIHGESRITPPGQTEQVFEGNRESANERKDRLIEHGIVEAPPPPIPPPPPPPEKPKGLNAVLEKMKKEGLTGGENPKPAFVRTEIDFGSWWSLRDPRDTSFVPDFSYGGGVLFFADTLLENTERDDWRKVLGLGFVTYNAGTYFSTSDLWGGKSDVYAESNALELGAWIGAFDEMSLENTVQNLSWDFRAGYFPAKWVKAISYTDVALSSKSEAKTHFGLNWTSFAASAGVYWGWAGFFDVGPFVSVQTSSPFQVRARAGIKISMQGR